MSATGNFIDADQALAWGLVNHVVPHDELLGFARALAADIVSSDQAAVAAILATYEEDSRGRRRRGLGRRAPGRRRLPGAAGSIRPTSNAAGSAWSSRGRAQV